MDLGLNGKVAIVTGSARGLGAATARRLAQEGAKVVITDILAEQAQATAAALQAQGLAAHCIVGDITKAADVQRLVDDTVAHFGGVHVLVNNAGWDHAARFVDTDPALWQKIVAINLMGPLNLQHCVVPGMLARGFGRIVNIASDAGRVGSSGESVYSACKGGIIAFTKTVAREVARKGITLNTVCPGPTDTPLLAAVAGADERGQKVRAALVSAIPMKRVGQPEDIPGAVCFLASEDAAFITGQTISVSGGLTMHG